MSRKPYSAAIESIVSIPRLPELGPGLPDRGLHSALSALTPENAVPGLHDRNLALACISGLWLFHDFLEESHAISQDIATPVGSFWHAIMHRREPDPANSKYWWRKVGVHPVLDQLKSEAPKLGYSFTTPYDFVDFCESVRGTGSGAEDRARQVQLLEWQLLFDWCYRHAAAESGVQVS